MARTRGTRAALAVAATVAVVAGMVSTASSDATSPKTGKLAPGVGSGKRSSISHASLMAAAKKARLTPRALADKKLPAGVPHNGKYAFLLKLSTPSTAAVYRSKARSAGAAAAKSAAKSHLASVRSAQNRVIASLPSKSNVLYRTHAVLSGVAVVTDVHNYAKLTSLAGVSAVYPIALKSKSNSYAVPLQGAPPAWQAYGDLGQNSTIAVIDTGIDYTHANFGGVGTVADYDAAKAQLGQPVSPNEFPGPKVVGGYDLAGDDYDPDSSDPGAAPAPDPYPLDCDGHGSHVAGTAAGLGENANGSTYLGAYNESTPFTTMRIGPGMAPEAKLYAYRIFGCKGSTGLVSAAIDMAADPNGDGDTSDHVDVINMSLGSDYGSPQDGDSVMTDAASALGITMVISSGNGGDLYDVGGSPGDAPRSLSVANSVDAYAQDDSLHVSAPAGIAGPYASERSSAFDYTTGDLAGDVVRVTQADNLDGCDPLNDADTAAVANHIAFVEWTDSSFDRRCGSVARGANLAAAGATGFIYGSDSETFGAGITGDATIPGVLVAKTGADAIRGQLLAHNTVTISSTSVSDFKQLDPTLNDTLSEGSSRGLGDAGNVKPDVTAVGTSVFSTGVGTGNEGLNDSGTSMASPMVAGTAALVISKNPNWVPEQVKADIMNTADQDLFTGVNHTGVRYAPERVGAGRIDAKSALDNAVLAYNADDPGSVSVSFGQLDVTAPETLTKTVRVQNTSLSTVSYDVSYEARTTIPGAEYSVSTPTVTVDPRSSATFTVTLTIDPTELTKTIDPTANRTQGGIPREYEADASGLVVLDGDGVPDLRVPVYSAPRPASVMTQPSSLTLPSGSVQSALLPLSGHTVNQGSGADTVQSIVAGFELQATSGALPNCTDAITSECISIPDDRSADLKYVGVTSDAPQIRSIGGDPNEDGLTYFAISTRGAWRTPAGLQEYDILIDTDRDDTPDLVLFNTRLPANTVGTDILVDELIDLNTGDVLDVEPINDRFGDLDTALLNSDTLVMPVAIDALGLSPTNSRLEYGVASFSAYSAPPLDSVGFDSAGPLSFDPLHPGVAVFGSYDGDASALLYRDSAGSVLAVRRDAAAYGLDHGLGALIVHFHNTLGNKAQRLALKTNSTVSLKLSPSPAKKNKTVIGTVTVAKSSGIAATGTVKLVRISGRNAPATVASGAVSNGKATLHYTPKAVGTYKYRAQYAGNTNYLAGNSATVTLKIT